MKGYQSLAPHGTWATYWLRLNVRFCRYQWRRATAKGKSLSATNPTESNYWFGVADWWSDRIDLFLHLETLLAIDEDSEDARLMNVANTYGG